MRLLLLAGTAEARDLAARLAADGRFDVIASLAGATKAPAQLPVPTRIGGFGGREAQEIWMETNGIEAVVDATHPFAARISARSQAICAARGLPCLRLLRPGWGAQKGDRWSRVPSLDAAAQAIPSGATAFLATGRQSLPAFAARGDVTLHLRRIDPADAPFPHPGGGYVIGRPPFTLEDEIRLFKDLRINVLVAKDSGGAADTKLAAARALGLPVILVDRPAPPPGPNVASVAAAFAWLEALV